MSQHNEEEQERNFVATKLFMSQHTIQLLTLQGMKKKCRNIRHLCRDNYKTNSTKLCHDTFNVCRDIIQEKGTEH